MDGYKICSRCIMDTSDPDISFDENGYCNHCNTAIANLNKYPFTLTDNQKSDKLNEIISKIKNQGKNKKYDCIIGISGGVDSTYLAYLTKTWGLRPLAIHLDNGWNSELAVQNIHNTLKKLNIDLYTVVLDWEEFRDIQLSFLKASVPDLEIPTDHAILATLFDVAEKYNIKYILNGSNYRTESILPRTWSNGHFDWGYIKYIQNKYGTRKIKKFPHINPATMGYRYFIKNINCINILNYIDYQKEKAINILETELNWKNYKTKHGESTYTFFIQSYILPTKFNYDKRRAHLSSLICSEQINRNNALEKITESIYTEQEIKYLKELVCDKLNITSDYFDELLKLPNKTYFDFPNYENKPFFILSKKIYGILKKLKYK